MTSRSSVPGLTSTSSLCSAARQEPKGFLQPTLPNAGRRRAVLGTSSFTGRNWLHKILAKQRQARVVQHAPGQGCAGRTKASAAELPGDDMQRVDSVWRWRTTQLRRIIYFSLPALSIPLADPLMSVVDTICIGQFAGTVELAALGPNLVVFNFFTYLLNALCISTVSAMSDHLRLADTRRAGHVLSTALFLAAASGLAVMAILLAWGPRLILATGCAPELLAPAWAYMRVRALAAPAVLIVMVAQSGLLAQRDSLTPFLCVAAQCALNVTGDVVLVGRCGWGLAGAAWATALAQWAAVAGLLLALADQKQVRPGLLRWPQRRDVGDLGRTFGPATALYFAKMLCYTMIQATASALPPAAVAAHQPYWSVWNLGAFCHTPLEQAALAFLPGAGSAVERYETVQVLLVLGGAVGVATALAAGGLPAAFPAAFTRDPALWPLMRSLAPQAILALLVCSMEVASTGILIASKQLSYLVQRMMLTLAAMTGYFWAARARGWGLGGVWWGLALFFGLRALQSTSRVLHLQRQARRAPDFLCAA